MNSKVQLEQAVKTLSVDIQSGKSSRVSGLLQWPKAPKACMILAHGAGAGMRHPYMGGLATSLADFGIATLRYQFPYMENSAKRPDSPAVCHATVRAAVDAAHELMPSLPLFAAGKSFGGRMTSQAQALSPLGGVLGLVFFGFPLHPPQQPSASRADHLEKIKTPLLFLQGSRDAFAERGWLEPVVEKLATATLTWVDEADHSFHVPARSGRTDDQVRTDMVAATVGWMDALISRTSLRAKKA